MRSVLSRWHVLGSQSIGSTDISRFSPNHLNLLTPSAQICHLTTHGTGPQPWPKVNPLGAGQSAGFLGRLPGRQNFGDDSSLSMASFSSCPDPTNVFGIAFIHHHNWQYLAVPYQCGAERISVLFGLDLTWLFLMVGSVSPVPTRFQGHLIVSVIIFNQDFTSKLAECI